MKAALEPNERKNENHACGFFLPGVLRRGAGGGGKEEEEEEEEEELPYKEDRGVCCTL